MFLESSVLALEIELCCVKPRKARQHGNERKVSKHRLHFVSDSDIRDTFADLFDGSNTFLADDYGKFFINKNPALGKYCTSPWD